jgi:serine/threonine protein phosphatase PrpC
MNLILKNLQAYSQADFDQPVSSPFLNGEAMFFTTRAPDKTTPNEDCLALIPFDADSGVLIVADGLGGLPAGSTASQLAIDTMSQVLDDAATADIPLRDAILNGIEQANQAILAQASGMATTLAVVEIQGYTVRHYHVGDAMIMVTGQRGKVKAYTVSHSPVGYAVEAGMLDEDEAVHHEERHIVSNVVGATDMHMSIGTTLQLGKRDTLLLASDGLFDNLYREEIVELIRKGPLTRAAAQLVARCHERMQHPQTGFPSHADDLSFILFRLSPNENTGS